VQASAAKSAAAGTTSPNRSTANMTSLAVLPPPPPPTATRSRDLVSAGGSDVIGRYVCTLYILLRVVYSVAFTFTGLYVCVAYLVSDDVAVLSSASHLQWKQRNASSALSDVIRRRWRSERQRQATLIDTQRQACAHYVDDLTSAIGVKVADAVAGSRQSRQRYSQSSTTVTDVVETRLLDALAEYDELLGRFKQRYRERLASDMSASRHIFTEYLTSVETNDWLGFARSLFNQSVEVSGVEHLLFHGAGDQRFQSAVLPIASTDSHPHGFNLSGVAADFASFIDIQEVEEIQLWSRQFWER